MEPIRLIAAILLTTFIGCNILYLFLRERGSLNFFERMAISYGLGIGALSLEMFLFSLAGLKYSAGYVILPWGIILVANIFIYFIKKPVRQKKPFYVEPGGMLKAGRMLSVFLSSGIVFEIAYSFFRALIKPIESYDAVAIYAIKAKIFYVARSIPEEFFSKLSSLFPHPDYPLNIPIFQAFLYGAMGSLNDQLVKIIFPLYFVSILAVLYFSVRRFAGSLYALLFTFILATIAQFNAYSTNGYIDLPLAYYCFISAILLFKYFEDTKKGYFVVLSAMMAGLAAWTKNEGILYCAVSLCLFALFLIVNRRKVSIRDAGGLFVYAGIIFIIYSPWLWTKAVYAITNVDVGPLSITPAAMVKQSYKALPILYEFQRQFFGPKKWNLIWIVAMFAVLFNYKKLFNKTLYYITAYLIFVFCGYILIYLISNVEIRYFLNTTWSRFPIHFMPVLVYWLALLLKEEIDL